MAECFDASMIDIGEEMLRIAPTDGLCLGLAAMAAAGQDCARSPWRPQDKIGAANRITAESVKSAASLVAAGKTYPFGIVVAKTTPAFAPRGTSHLRIAHLYRNGFQRRDFAKAEGVT